MSREALRLSEQTGCLLSEATTLLELEGEFSTAFETMQIVLAHRRELYEHSVTLVWDQFAKNENELGIDATIEFINALGLEPEDPVVLTLAYELQSPETGRFLRQPFVDGWARLEARNLEEMRKCMVYQRERFAEYEYFRTVYRFTYKFVLASEEGRNLPLDTAIAYWDLLLSPRYPDTLSKWIRFIKLPRISADTWNMLLEFCEYATKDPQFGKYDANSAWPIVFDEFVRRFPSI